MEYHKYTYMGCYTLAFRVDTDANARKKYQLRDSNFRENKFQLKELKRVSVVTVNASHPCTHS